MMARLYRGLTAVVGMSLVLFPWIIPAVQLALARIKRAGRP